MRHYSAYQFALLRIVLGAYCAVYFVSVFPHAGELFSNQGMLPDAEVNWFYGYFPNILYLNDSLAGVQTLLVAALCASLLFMLGSWRRTAAVVIWFSLACLFNRNNLFWSPAFPLVGWLLLATLFVPRGEPWSLSSYRSSCWQLPKELYVGAWLVLAISYSVSGFYKLLSPSWVDGTALAQTLRWTWARDWIYPDLLLAAPASLMQFVTWGTLVLELVFVLLIIFPKGRMFAWVSMTLTHINILLLLDLADLTLGVLMFHLFIFDTRWFQLPKRTAARAAHSPVRLNGAIRAAAYTLSLILFASAAPPAYAGDAPLEVNPLIPLRTQYNQLKRDCSGRRDSKVCKDLERKMLEKMKELRQICRDEPGDHRCGALARPSKDRTNRMEVYCFENPHATKCIRRREQQRRREKLLRKFCGKNPDEKRCQPSRAKTKDNRSYIARLCEENPESVRCRSYKKRKEAKYGSKDDEKGNAF